MSWKTISAATPIVQSSQSIALAVEFIPGDWRHGADHAAIEERLKKDTKHAIKAVCVVHNETSTGVTTRIPLVRNAIDNAKHPALLMVDTISSLGSIDYRHDEWGVDVTVGGSQKGLMLPPGMAFTAINDRVWQAAQVAKNPRKYWDWRPMIDNGRQVHFCGTPPITHFYGLEVSLDMLEEGRAETGALLAFP